MATSLKWDIDDLSKAMKITKDDVKQYFTDGRKVSFILERRIAYEFFKGKLAKTESEDYDLIDRKGHRWEVRSITKGGVYFCPSNQVGKGRVFERKGFLKKLRDIDGYVLADVLEFPNVPFWVITSDVVRKWWDEGSLGKNSHISHKKALELIKG